MEEELSKSQFRRYKVDKTKEMNQIIEILSEEPKKYKKLMTERYGEQAFKNGYKIVKANKVLLMQNGGLDELQNLVKAAEPETFEGTQQA